MEFLIFGTLSLKTPIHATQFFFWGGDMIPETGAVLTEAPKGTFWAETVPAVY